jgi:hypothetical protein
MQEAEAGKGGVMNESFLEIQHFETEKYAAPLIEELSQVGWSGGSGLWRRWCLQQPQAAAPWAHPSVRWRLDGWGQLGEQRARKIRDNLRLIPELSVTSLGARV